MDPLKEPRERLNALDEKIALLLNERMALVETIGQIKHDQHLAVLDKSRENEIYDHLSHLTLHPILKEHIAKIYSAIMDVSKIAQKFKQSDAFPFHQIGMIGVGLMGGSICKALKTRNPSIQISALKTSTQDEELAVNAGIVDKQCYNLSDLIQSSELIILATPLSTIIPYAQDLHKVPPKGKKTLIIDIGSVKKEIVNEFQKLSSHLLEYLGTHPMAGTEKNGFQNSISTIFVNRPWIITPHQQNTTKSINQIRELILYCGAIPIELDAHQHDRQAALISHLPGILSKAYFDFVSQNDAPSLNLAGPGFTSFTRLAHDNPHLRAEISQSNRILIQELLKQWISKIS